MDEKLKAIVERLHALREKYRSIVDAGESGERKFDAKVDRELNDLLEEIESLERQEKHRRELVEMERRQAAAAAGASHPGIYRPGPADGTELNESTYRPPSGFQGRTFRDLFGSESISSGGFRNMEEFLGAVHNAQHQVHPELRATAMGEGVPADGGFSVPTEFAAEWLDSSLEAEIVRPRAKVWKMEAPTRKVPGWDGSDHSSNLFGGFSGIWLAEHGTASKQKAKLRAIELKAKKLGIYTQASNELLQDGLGFKEMLNDALVQALGWYLDYAFLRGTGSGQPLGVLSDPALVTQNKEAGQAASTVVAENIINMYSRMWGPGRSRAVWVVNSDVLPQLYTLALNVGTGGAPVFQPVGGLSQSPYNTILGRPVLLTEKIPTLGTLGDIIFADFSQYAVGMRMEMSLDRSNAPGWTEDQTDYRVILRVDGQGQWNQAITPKNGSTQSWAVTLQAR